MSASPSGRPSTSSPRARPDGLKIIRKKRNDNPLVRPKRRPYPHARQPAKPTSNDVPKAGTATLGASTPPLDPSAPIIPPADTVVNGFTDPDVKEGTYQDYELWTVKRELREGIRHHMARFFSKRPVNPSQEDDFTRPVRLHRRDPRSKFQGKEEQNGQPELNGIDDKDKEIEAWKVQREQEREANLAQIAPDAVTGQKKKKIAQQKTAEVHGINQTPEQQARSRLRYEEAIPWHLEDFDNKNTWVGSYEDAMSLNHAILTFQNGTCTMAPVEKWYRFTRKDQFKTLGIEEVEASMKRKVKDPRWMMQHKEDEERRKEEMAMSRAAKGLYVGKEGKEATSGSMGRRRDLEDADEIDFDHAEAFADDEEDNLFEGEEEEAKEAEKRIKKDRLKANFFGQKDENEYDKEERDEKQEKDAEKVKGKAMRKALKKREKRFVYQSDDSEDNPFSDSGSSTDSEEERAREEQRKADEERKAKDKATKLPADKPPSGASTKGTNTPSGRPKHSDPLKKEKLKSLKRPGSPDLSEYSGTDTSRKKSKKKHPSSHPTRTSTPQPGSRPMSPVYSAASSALASQVTTADRPQPVQRKSSIVKLPVDPTKLAQVQQKKRQLSAGSGSDGEGGAAASGAEMSDGGTTVVKKQLKLNPPGSKGTTPVGSRAGSPKPLVSGVPNKPQGHPGLAPGPLPPNFPTLADIRAIIPPTGITTQELSQAFKSRIQGRTREFIELVRAAGNYDGKSMRLMPRTMG